MTLRVGGHSHCWHYMTCHLLDAFIQSDLHTQYCGQFPQEQFGVKCLRDTPTCWLQWGLNLCSPDPNTNALPTAPHASLTDCLAPYSTFKFMVIFVSITTKCKDALLSLASMKGSMCSMRAWVRLMMNWFTQAMAWDLQNNKQHLVNTNTCFPHMSHTMNAPPVFFSALPPLI